MIDNKIDSDVAILAARARELAENVEDATLVLELAEYEYRVACDRLVALVMGGRG